MTHLQDNQWTRPIRRGYICACCDCGLRHSIDFKLVRKGRVNHIEFRARRISTRKKK